MTKIREVRYGVMIRRRFRCKRCDGEGEVTRPVQIEPGVIEEEQVECPRCNGTGHDESVEAIRKEFG